MDLRLFWAVTKRFKRVAIGGFLLAVVLAVLAYGTPGPGGITPHGTVTYESQAVLLITQSNGAYGRADSKTLSVGAPGYMASLSPIYAGLANGTAVQDAIRAARIPGRVGASEGVDPQTGAYTPFVTLTAVAPTAADAGKLSQKAVAAFRSFVSQMEANSGVPSSTAVALEVVSNGLPPTIASQPKPTIPVLVFIAVMAGTRIRVARQRSDGSRQALLARTERPSCRWPSQTGLRGSIGSASLGSPTSAHDRWTD
jgi:hypothetical protein